MSFPILTSPQTAPEHQPCYISQKHGRFSQSVPTFAYPLCRVESLRETVLPATQNVPHSCPTLDTVVQDTKTTCQKTKLFLIHLQCLLFILTHVHSFAILQINKLL